MAKKQSGKILRIGILHQGRVVEERYMRKRHTITLGTSPKNTFIIPYSDKPIPKYFPLFMWKKNHYELMFTPSMAGKISLDGQILGFKEIVQAGRAQSQKGGKVFALPLNEAMRGKVTIGEISIIFHFVQAPPMPAKMKLPASVRGGWVKSIDWPFVAIFFISFIVNAAFFGYSATQPRPKKASLETMNERFAKFVAPELPKEEEKKEEPKDVPKTENKTAQKKEEKKEEVAEEKPEREPLTEEEAARAEAQRRAELSQELENTGLLRVIGAKGPGGGAGQIADLLGEGGSASEMDLDEAMQGVKGLGIADSGLDRGSKDGNVKAGDRKELNKIGVSKGGQAKLKGGRKAKLSGKASMGSLDVEGTLSAGAIKQRVKRYLPAIKNCYERELKKSPNLKGKITVEIVIGVTGTVSEVSIVYSSMKNATVERCIKSIIKKILFPRPSDGEAFITWPFIFQSSK